MKWKKSIIYNFFESWHGYSVCDGAAANAKKKLKNEQRDNPSHIIKRPEEFAEIIGKIAHAEGRVLEIQYHQEYYGLNTKKDIRSFHKYVFRSTSTCWIECYDDSTVEKFTKRFRY